MHRHLRAGSRIQSLVKSCEIPGGRSGAGERFSYNLFGIPHLIMIPPLLSAVTAPWGVRQL
jgi:hypothetical protein